MALMAKGNESYTNIGAVKLREMKPNASLSETSPNKYWKNQAGEVIINPGQIYLGPEG